MKISLAAMAALVVVGASTLAEPTVANAQVQGCAPYETTALVFPNSGRDMYSGYIACVSPGVVRMDYSGLLCIGAYGGQKKLYGVGEGPEPECRFPDGSTAKRRLGLT